MPWGAPAWRWGRRGVPRRRNLSTLRPVRAVRAGADLAGDDAHHLSLHGQREEAGIGLYDYGARWYDGALGRFIQPDTVVPEPGNPQSLNRYSYALNNLLRYTDPSGHFPWLAIPVLVGLLMVRGDTGPYNDVSPLQVDVQDALLRTCDPYDWFRTAQDCASGQCNALDVTFAVLPLVSGGLARGLRQAGAEIAGEVVSTGEKALDPAQAAQEAYRAARNFNYRGVYFAAHPELRRFAEQITVHHSVPLVFCQSSSDSLCHFALR